MGLFNNWPYTNIHELNLDWIIQEIRKLIDEYKRLDESNKDLQKNFVELKEYVITYFDNLDLQEEVNEFFNQLIESGQLDQIILDAFDNLDHRVDEVQASIENAVKMLNAPVTARIGIVKTQMFESSGLIPQLVCNNTSRGYKTYVTGTVNGVTYIGDLDGDNITPRNRYGIPEPHHANDVTYNPNNDKLYIADLTNEIKIYNGTTLAYEGTMTIEGLTLPIRGVEFYDNKLYFSTSGADEPVHHIAQYGYYDFETELPVVVPIHTDIQEWIYQTDTIGEQGMFIYKGVPYQIVSTISYNGGYSGTVYYQIDLLNKQVRPAVRVEHMGESEGCVVIEKDKILQYAPLNSRLGSVMEITMFGGEALNTVTLYVDGTAYEVGEGTQEKPFKTITNALVQAACCQNAARIEIRLLSDITEDVAFYELKSRPVIINGMNHTLTDSATTNIYNYDIRIIDLKIVKTGGWNFNNCKLMLNNVTIEAIDAAAKINIANNTVLTANGIKTITTLAWTIIFRNSGGWMFINVAEVTTSINNPYLLYATTGVSFISGSKGTLTNPAHYDSKACGESKLA